ncbi:C2 domain-containing protein [Thamnocephalis sphaerospora]|uniref:C2 domain-containing protein n=1 Tax=Thamnocephalis sphaerospora TaxID=78915 RepID=A0A4V1IXB2_9FUNG|nr:C2 domain-containing protein [Thamnocephalis sphaerospora]|eukprot:RKP10449.1 C2 domain-containing protein [Thamnocephalis sphaerospora]
MVTLRIHLIEARGLAPKDSNGLADPYAVIRFSTSKKQTKTIYKTLDPVWDQGFSFDVNGGSSVVNITLWDKDTLGRDYMGEINVPAKHLFTRNCPRDEYHEGGQPMEFNDPRNMPVWYAVQSRNNNEQVSGSVLIKAGLYDNGKMHSDEEWIHGWSTICAQLAKQ